MDTSAPDERPKRSLASRATYAARHAAKDASLTYEQARQRAQEAAADLQGTQLSIYLSIWHTRYTAIITRRQARQIIAEADNWLGEVD